MKMMKVEIIKGVPGITGKKLYLFKTRKPGLIKFQAAGKLTVKKNVTGVEWQHAEGRNVGKTAVGAIGGGILAGPLGLIAGAALGGKKRDISTAAINFEDGGQLLVRMDSKEYEAICSWLNL